MAFFTDPTISTLTSGTPSQNTDLAGVSFPRRIGFRLADDYARKWGLIGQQSVWQAYKDPSFSQRASLGSQFYYEGLINRTRWVQFFFKGIFPQKSVYLRCTIRNLQTHMAIKTFYFQFTKSYLTSFNGRTYIEDPILHTKIIKNGVLTEIRPFMNRKTRQIFFKPAAMTYTTTRLADIMSNIHTEKVQAPVIIQKMVHYAEKPKMIFLVTPPHLQSYAKIILILLKQLVDLNFEQAYLTEANQKPLYKTRFMLDELGYRFPAAWQHA